ncbi:MAG: hypothetical protein JWP91_702 [Fibrobacteres bacterium]|nr:hypothetical protein [Fibrobacterota bacterium]
MKYLRRRAAYAGPDPLKAPASAQGADSAAAKKPALQAAPAPKAQAVSAPVTAPAAPAASGRKTCEDVKAEIDGKLKAKGVKAFTLGILPSADVKTEKVVGSCEAGAKKITYKRG